MNKPSNIAVVVLAAGASTRMGRPKQLLPWGNITLLEHTIQTVLRVHAKETAVVLGANYYLIKKEIETYPITFLNNTSWELGLGKSISEAVKYLKQSALVDGAMIVLADQPFVSSEFLRTMITAFTPGNGEIIATAYDIGKQGVPVLFDKIYFKELENLNDDFGAKHILKKYNSHVKVLDAPEKNIDLDSEADYRVAYQKKIKKQS